MSVPASESTPSLSAAEALAATPFFAALDTVEIARLVPELEELHFEPGAAIFCRGDQADGLYLIRSGEAELTVASENGAQAVRLLEAGSYFGEGALLRDAPRAADVMVRTPLTVWKLPRERFDALVQDHPDLPRQIVAELAHRLADALGQLSATQERVAVAARAAYGSLDPAAQSMLRRLAVYREFDRELLGDLLGSGWSEPTFQRLLDEVVFFGPGEREGWFRIIQQAVRRFLLHQLRAELGERELASFQRRAADLLLARGEADPEQALELLLEAADWRRLGRLLEERGADLARQEPERVERYLRALPPGERCRRAPLVALLAACCTAQGKLEQAIDCYREAEQHDPTCREGPLAITYQRALAALYERIGHEEELLACRQRIAELERRRRDQSRAEANAQLQTDLPLEVVHDAARRDGANAAEQATPRSGLAGIVATFGRGGLSWRWMACLVVVVLGGLAWLLPPPAGLSPSGLRVLATIMALVALSFLDVLPDYLLGLLMIAVWVVSGTLPAAVAAAGFASSTFFLLLASMAIGTAVERSGLLYRGAIEIVRRLPPRHAVRCLSLVGLGVLVSPGMPSNAARLLLAGPLTQDIADSLRYPPRSPGAAGLGLSTFLGFGLLGPLFLTGSPMCLILYGLLPPEVQARMGWGNWFLAALPTILVLGGLTMAFLLLRYRPEDDHLPAATLALQRRMLGRLGRAEWTVLVVLVVLLLGFATQSLHGLDAAWLAVAAAAVLFVAGPLDDNTFRNGVNLSLLLYAGVILGFGEIFAQVELDRWLSQNVEGLAGLTRGDPVLFLLAVTAISALLGVLLRPGPIAILLTLALAPVATQIGVSPWTVALTSILATNLWLYPQQNMLYLTAYHATGERAFSHVQARPLAFVYAAAVFVAILASVPYWRLLGLIG